MARAFSPGQETGPKEGWRPRSERKVASERAGGRTGEWKAAGRAFVAFGFWLEFGVLARHVSRGVSESSRTANAKWFHAPEASEEARQRRRGAAGEWP